MNRLYLVSNDGRIFFAEAASGYFEPLNVQEYNPIKIKKISPSDWCLWIISSTFKVYLYVFKTDTPIQHQEFTYENQRRYNLLSSSSFTNQLLPTDRWNFSSKDGTVELKKENIKLPSDCWVWDSDWTCELNISDGWEYAHDFPSNYYPKFFPSAFVRRKKWIRNRTFESFDRFIEINSPKDNECMIDISIGGWAIPFCERGHLSVWAISNIGNLFYRRNVNYSNLEGDKWEQIYLPRRTGSFSCNCSSLGDLWVITYEGDVLVRIGVNRDQPSGNGWIEIGSTGIGSIFRQLSIGKRSIWALDNQGHVFYRAGINDSKPEGTKWVHIPANMSNISVSSSDQLWAIDADEMSLNLRCGIDEENIHGTGWKKVNLKSKPISEPLVDSDQEILKPEEINEIMKHINFRDSELENENFHSNKNAITDYSPKLEEPKKKTPEPIYFEDSIYDSDSDLSIKSQTFQPKLEFEIKAPNSFKEINIKELIKENAYENVLTTLNENTQQIDDYIDKIKKLDIDKSTKSDDLEIYSSSTNSNNFLINRDHSGSNVSETYSNASFSGVSDDNYSKDSDQISLKSNSGSIGSTIQLNLLSFKICNASNFLLDSNNLPANWFDSNADIIDEQDEETYNKKSEWRNKALNELIKRNIKETFGIDKISNVYENSTWSRKQNFSVVEHSKTIDCSIEIITNSDNYQIEKSFQAKLLIKPLKKTKWQIELDIKDIIAVTRWVYEKKPTTPCFALFVNKKSNPILVLSSSQNIIDDWFSQIAIYCSKTSGLISTLAACTMTNLNGTAYYCYMRSGKPLLFKQIDGNLKLVEKHVSGITFGLGENGKLWALSTSQFISLDCYKGPYLQTDEIEIFTYENQRWNMISGILGQKDGYTSIGFPTDRYNWSDETGKIRRRKDECTLPSSWFNWSTPWQIDFLTPGGVDKDGWQYAFDFPSSYHPIRVPVTDYVRRRRWVRKCRSKVNSLWREVIQGHRLTCLAMDQEIGFNRLLPKNTVLCWATDSDGFILSSLITEANPTNLKWQNVFSRESFKYVSIGVNLRIWAIDVNGKAYIRYEVDRNTNYCGSSWNLIESIDNPDLRFSCVSVGNDSVWAVSLDKELYFRENVSKSFPEGTEWVRISSMIKYVTVNSSNQVYAISSEESKNPNILLFRDGITSKTLKGTKWIEVISMKAKMFSNRGNFF